MVAQDITELIDCLKDDDEVVRERALHKIVAMGSEAVTDLTMALPNRRVQLRKGVVEALGLIGEAAGPAAPSLVETLADPQVRRQSMIALSLIGPSAVPALVSVFHDTSVQCHAAESLRLMGPSAERAVVDLADALRFGALNMRIKSMEALAHIGAAAVPELIELLEDDDVRVRECAVQALHHIGADAGEAAQALETALQDESPRIRERAEQALRRIRKSDPS